MASRQGRDAAWKQLRQREDAVDARERAARVAEEDAAKAADVAAAAHAERLRDLAEREAALQAGSAALVRPSGLTWG